MESISKLEVISLILKTSYDGCGIHELNGRIHSNLTMNQLNKFILELKKYGLLISIRNESNYIITPKGMYYLQIYDELANQLYSKNNTNSPNFVQYLYSMFQGFNKFICRKINCWLMVRKYDK